MNKTEFEAHEGQQKVVVIKNSARYVDGNIFVSCGKRNKKKIINVHPVNIDRLSMDENRRLLIKKHVLKVAARTADKAKSLYKQKAYDNSFVRQPSFSSALC